MIYKLKKMCENLIDMTLTCKNVLTLLRYTDTLNLTTLKVKKTKLKQKSIQIYIYF